MAAAVCAAAGYVWAVAVAAAVRYGGLAVAGLAVPDGADGVQSLHRAVQAG